TVSPSAGSQRGRPVNPGHRSRGRSATRISSTTSSPARTAPGLNTPTTPKSSRDAGTSPGRGRRRVGRRRMDIGRPSSGGPVPPAATAVAPTARPTPATAAAIPAAAATPTPVFAGLGLIHRQVAPIELHPVDGRDGLVPAVAHLDEREAPRAAGLPVHNELHL